MEKGLRGQDLNLLPSGYEPEYLPLALYLVPYFCQISSMGLAKDKLPSGLKIVKLDSQGKIIKDNREASSWMVDIGKKITGAKRQRKEFHSYKDAKRHAEAANEARQDKGRHALLLTAARMHEAKNCYDRLDLLGVGLTTAVDAFIKSHIPVGKIKTFAEVATEFTTDRLSYCDHKTMANYRSQLRKISEEYGQEKITEIKRQDIEDWLAESDWSSRTRKNYAVTLTTIFNFAIRREYSTVNPAALVRRPVLDDSVPGILTPKQAKHLLEKAFELDKAILPGVAVGLFAGLRRSEICSLDWNEVNLAERTLVVLGKKAKTRQRRVVSITDNLFRWLGPKPGTGPLTFTSPDLFGERLRAIAKAIGIANWPHNALRHSYGSYLFAERKNENLVAAEMGNSPGVVFRHYRALVKSQDAIAYWGIEPDSLECR